LSKALLYDKLENLILQQGVALHDHESRAKALTLLGKLRDGKKVQESSAETMSFLILFDKRRQVQKGFSAFQHNAGCGLSHEHPQEESPRLKHVIFRHV
jgi:hypothetical protein